MHLRKQIASVNVRAQVFYAHKMINWDLSSKKMSFSYRQAYTNILIKHSVVETFLIKYTFMKIP